MFKYPFYFLRVCIVGKLNTTSDGRNLYRQTKMYYSLILSSSYTLLIYFCRQFSNSIKTTDTKNVWAYYVICK